MVQFSLARSWGKTKFLLLHEESARYLVVMRGVGGEPAGDAAWVVCRYPASLPLQRVKIFAKKPRFSRFSSFFVFVLVVPGECGPGAGVMVICFGCGGAATPKI